MILPQHVLKIVEAYVRVAKLEHTPFYELSSHLHHLQPQTHQHLNLHPHLSTLILLQAQLGEVNNLEHTFVCS